MYLAFFRNTVERDRLKSNPIPVNRTDQTFFFQGDLPADEVWSCDGSGLVISFAFGQDSIEIGGKNYNIITVYNPFKCGLLSIMVKYGENYQWSEWLNMMEVEFSATDDAFQLFHLPIMYSDTATALDKTKRNISVFEKDFLPQFETYHEAFDPYLYASSAAIYLVNEAGAETKISETGENTVYKKRPDTGRRTPKAAFVLLGEAGSYPVGWYRYRVYVLFATEDVEVFLIKSYYSDWFYLADPNCDTENNIIKITLQTNNDLGKIPYIYGSEFTFKIPAFLREIEVPKTEDGDNDINQQLIPTLIYHKNRYIMQTGLIDSQTVDVLRTLPFWDSVIIESITKTIFDIKDVDVSVEWQFESKEFAIATINMEADLIYKDILPPVYTAEFYITNICGPIEGAEIEINGETITTNALGYASIELFNGTYDYSVTATRNYPKDGTIIIANASESESVHLIKVRGLYTLEELRVLINDNGYIPVATGAELNALRTTAARTMGAGTEFEGTYTTGKDKKYVMVDDVSLADYQTGSGWDPIGSSGAGNTFTGIFDGNELNINDLVCNNSGTNFRSLLGIGTGKAVNIRIVNCNITGGTYTAGIYGYFLRSDANSTIDNCQVSGTINGVNNIGGICGVNFDISGGVTSGGIITNCKSTAVITATDSYNGGIVGYSRGANAYISYCEFTGSLNNTHTATNALIGFGGIAGYSGNNIFRCKVNATLTNKRVASCSGIVGRTAGTLITVEECEAFGSISANFAVSGIVGAVESGAAKIKNCKSEMAVIVDCQYQSTLGTEWRGAGLYSGGSTAMTIENSFTVSAVSSINYTAGTRVLRAMSYITPTTVTNSYWSTEASGQASGLGGIDKTIAQLKAGAIGAADIFTGWSTDIWDAGDNDTYPFLKALAA